MIPTWFFFVAWYLVSSILVIFAYLAGEIKHEIIADVDFFGLGVFAIICILIGLFS